MVNETSGKGSSKGAKPTSKGAKPTNLTGSELPTAKTAGDGPQVLRFEARIFRPPKTAVTKTGSRTLLGVPEWISEQFPSHCTTTVEGTINGHPFRAVLEPEATGGHRLRVNKAMLRGADANAGDTVKLAILGPEPEPTVPADLRLALASSHEARTLWDDLTSMGRRDWVRWVESARQTETRTRRVARTVEQLSEGKRRACCVNVYEFMLRHIQEDDETKGS
ncbi:Bacteriocin-protection, YdeI or OmpD-Associated [Rubrobacter radiotolerans]|uniref:Bacteriocin-protection, YdeI or OmpD-Associated n=1 Tax=Rubrobacter radiotolerans TaxID=42256 RepID=A0A023WZU3_RUBRA|nr:YdeI/OmpD-associated family protein [Rubrobacter radiotolerans]AHY45563.1 Bacteriocin-protection, YdeI or OmpD-Associated [Rubrobacter radiotolerans]MDX5892977.1 YdeI/OmpD-associated family protein [Rubrobacter radiotolerans]SMC02845.1 protein of unknown function [Rubrobacter radiotolerans DSM 5868]